MSGLLLDTNVLSEVLKKSPAKPVLDRLQKSARHTLHTSVICVMELRSGALRHPRPEVLWTRILGEVLSLVRILPLETADSIHAGDILAELTRRGHPIGVEDILIAATARNRRLTLITRNTRHLSRVSDLRTENWWESSA